MNLILYLLQSTYNCLCLNLKNKIGANKNEKRVNRDVMDASIQFRIIQKLTDA
jgi:hypothetical protein